MSNFVPLLQPLLWLQPQLLLLLLLLLKHSNLFLLIPADCHQISCMKQESHLLNWRLCRWKIDCFSPQKSLIEWIQTAKPEQREKERGRERKTPWPFWRLHWNQEVRGSSPACSKLCRYKKPHSFQHNHTFIVVFLLLKVTPHLHNAVKMSTFHSDAPH